MNKYFVKDRVKEDIEFTIEAENMVDAVAKCRKYIEENIQKYLSIMIVFKLKKYLVLIS